MKYNKEDLKYIKNKEFIVKFLDLITDEIKDISKFDEYIEDIHIAIMNLRDDENKVLNLNSWLIF